MYTPWPGTPLSVRLRQQYRTDVVAVQEALGNLGHPVVVDGYYGPATATSVRRIQREHGLAVDGIVGADTWDVVQWALGNFGE